MNSKAKTCLYIKLSSQRPGSLAASYAIWENYQRHRALDTYDMTQRQISSGRLSFSAHEHHTRNGEELVPSPAIVHRSSFETLCKLTETSSNLPSIVPSPDGPDATGLLLALQSLSLSAYPNTKLKDLLNQIFTAMGSNFMPGESLHPSSPHV